ncbi:MAG: hypothetical protein QW756_08575, partial [Nitrososphaerota archaeon]
SRGYAYLLLHNLVSRGEIRRLVKGWYTTCDDPVVSVFAFRPAYLGLEEALSLRGLWEQETNVVIVTPLRVRVGMRRIMDSNVVVRRISSKYFFGVEYLRYGDLFLPVSDVEKTLVDFFYFDEPIDSRTLKKLWRLVDRRRVFHYLRRFPRAVGSRVRKAVV